MNSPIETYKTFSRFYDMYVGKFDSDFDFYKSYCHKTDSIVEIGCGTGRILSILLQSGCKVTGVDISQEMLNIASKKFDKQIRSEKLSILNHDFKKDKLTERFDKALLTFYTFNYILDNPIIFLENIYHSLKDNGLLLLDLFYPKSLFDKSIDGKWIKKEYHTDNQLIEVRDCRAMKQDIEHRQQIFSIDGVETKIITRRKYYSPLTLKKMMISTGYTDIVFSYDYDYNGFKEVIDETRLKKNYIVKAKK